MSVEKFQELGRVSYRQWRADQAAARAALRLPKTVEKTVYVEVQGPEVRVLEEALSRMEAAAKAPKPPEKPAFKFAVSALQDERFPEETLAETDERLEAELADLEARLANIAKEGLDRHTELSGKLYKKVGA